MDLLELARTIQIDKTRSIEQDLRRRRLLTPTTSATGPASNPGRSHQPRLSSAATPPAPSR